MGIEKEKGKTIVEGIAEKLSHHRNIYTRMGYLSLHISVTPDTESLFMSLLMHSHFLESTGETPWANSPGEGH